MSQFATPVLATGSFNVTRADLAASYRANLRWRFARPRAWLTPAAIAALAVVAAAAGDPTASAGALLEPAAVIMALAVAFRFATYLAMPLYAAREFRGRTDLGQQWEVEFSADGMRARTPGMDTAVSWGKYVAWSRDRHVVLVYQSDRLFQFMPVRAITPAMEQVFSQYMGHKPRR